MTTRKMMTTAVVLGLVVSLGTTACAVRQKGTAQRAGEKIDRALGTDK